MHYEAERILCGRVVRPRTLNFISETRWIGNRIDSESPQTLTTVMCRVLPAYNNAVLPLQRKNWGLPLSKLAHTVCTMPEPTMSAKT